jgi:alpha-1,2-mannosyltransferase
LVAKWMVPTCWILAYVHYPTISTDMMQWERQRKGRAIWKTWAKLIYYKLFAVAYGLVGSLADLVMVNSTWTYNHIQSLWWYSKRIDIVYPPCRVDQREAPKSNQRQPIIVSIGQFRPEKNHRLQIEAVHKLLQQHPNVPVELVLIGSCRNEHDEKRVDELRQLVQTLRLEKVVQFNINPPYRELQESMLRASIGIHTMRQEHFGIGIVEMMAAGLIVVAHNSGGPKEDIVKAHDTGYLATTAEGYATALYQALTMNEMNANQMRKKAQESALRFSDPVFDQSLSKSLAMLE